MKTGNGTSRSNKDAIHELVEQMRFAPETGHILLFDQRMLLMHGFSLAELRRELIERLGTEMARGIFTRLGYQQGLADYKRIRDQFGDTMDRAIMLGPTLRNMEGYVQIQPVELRFNEESGEFFGNYIWNNSWEAEAHLNHIGLSGTPNCWMNIGYANAYATSFFGRPLLFREVECMSMGHSRCRAVGKPVSEWQDVNDELRFMQVEDFVDPPIQRTRSTPLGAKPTMQTPNSPLTNELIGASAAFNGVAYLLKRVAQTDATVLFLGESGVGKERFSRALHDIGPRAAGPFISVNCAAIPHDLVEAELFGVEKGAFTGATASRQGRFERADGGTLFLDEIGSLSLPAQGKLLRALQEREIERVGGTQVKKVNVRLVAATNEDLRGAVEVGKFRADLFFRLNVFPIRIPPLRERLEDIPLLLNVFVDRCSQRFGKRIKGVTRNAIDALWHYAWPGNVRELENMVERAVILCDDGSAIDMHHLFSGGERIDTHSLTISTGGSLTDLSQADQDSRDNSPRALVQRLLDHGQSLHEIEQSILECALERNQGRISSTARQLKIGRGRMQYKMSKLAADPKGTKRKRS